MAFRRDSLFTMLGMPKVAEVDCGCEKLMQHKYLETWINGVLKKKVDLFTVKT